LAGNAEAPLFDVANHKNIMSYESHAVTQKDTELLALFSTLDVE
jgi:hypothetical protein